MITRLDLIPKAKKVADIYWNLSLIASSAGTICSGFLRLELLNNQTQIWENLYMSVLTIHGLLFVFFVLVPIGQAFLNWWFPGLSGSSDFYWPRVNLGASLWTSASAALILVSWVSEGGWGVGWTLYPPLSSITLKPSIDAIIAGIHILGIASGLAGLNTLVSTGLDETSLLPRELSLFIWAQGFSAILFIGSLPTLALGVTGILLDKSFLFSWFDPSGGGDPVMFQTLFWFFGHPEVYVVILPAFGVVSLSIESEGLLFGRNGMIASIGCLGVLGFIVYAHHMFTLELEIEVKLMFSASTMGIALPTGVKIFAWILSFRQGIRPSQYFVTFLCFIVIFIGGGITGIILSACAIDLMLHDTYFVVAHFHQIMAVSALLAFACGIPMSHLNCQVYKTEATLGILVFSVGTLILFLPMYWSGLSGMPRRVPGFSNQAGEIFSWTLIGYLLSCMGAILVITCY